MSGTGSPPLPPIPPEATAAPLTPEQRKAYAEIGAALAGADACFVNPAPDATRSGDWQQSFDVQFPATQPALSAPQPAADERVAEHMRLVREACIAWGEWAHDNDPDCAKENAAISAVESSARALLAAGRDEVAALQAQIAELEARQAVPDAVLWHLHCELYENTTGVDAAAAIRHTRVKARAVPSNPTGGA